MHSFHATSGESFFHYNGDFSGEAREDYDGLPPPMMEFFHTDETS